MNPIMPQMLHLIRQPHHPRGQDDMQRINLAQDVHPLSTFRKRASALIDHVQQTRRPLVLTRNGKSAAIVLDAREFEQMVERLELLEDVHAAREQARQGETVPQEQALDYLTARLRATGSAPEDA